MKKPQPQISFRVDQNLYSLLASEASKKGIPINSFARQMIADHLLANDEQIQILNQIRALCAANWAYSELDLNREDLDKIVARMGSLSRRLPKLISLLNVDEK